MSKPIKDGFNDSYVGKHVAPEVPTTTPDEELHKNERLFPRERDEAIAMQTALLCEIFSFILATKVKTSDKRYLKSIALRSIAVAWVCNPKNFTADFTSSDSKSLRSIAADIGVEATSLSNLTAEFSRIANTKNRWQSHDWRN